MKTNLFTATIKRIAYLFCLCLFGINAVGRGSLTDGFPLNSNEIAIDSTDCDCEESPPEFKIGDHVLSAGESNYCLTLDVEHFNQVSDFQFILSWNPHVLSLSSGEDLQMLDQPIIFNDAQSHNGLVFVLWSMFQFPASVGDDTSLLELCFDVVGDTYDSTSINLIGGFNLEIPSITYATDDFGVGCIHDFDNEPIGNVEIGCSDLFVKVAKCHTDTEGGSISVAPCGGEPPYTFVLSPIGVSGIISEGAEYLISNLIPGDYTLTVIDALGTEFIEQSTIENKAPLSILDLDVRVSLCSEFNQGSLEIQGLGGSSFGIFGYEYEWSNYQYTAELSNLPTDIYTVTVTDLDNCTIEKTYNFEVLPIELTDVNLTPASSCDENDASMSFNIIGGAGSGYIVTVFSETFIELDQSFFLIDSLAVGEYPINVKDSLGCEIDTLVTIGNILLGTPCDDGLDCTSNDAIDMNCNCVGVESTGCIDPNFCEYDPNAICDDGSCMTLLTEEICDGIDNDCDGDVDEGFELYTYYIDFDGDGFGDTLPTDITTTCSEVPPPGFADNFDDCNDFDASINPDAEDIPNDGIDQNCDGLDFISSVSDSGVLDEVNIAPNPVIDLLSIDSRREIYSIDIYSTSGQHLNSFYEINALTTSINTSNLVPGVYISVIYFSDGSTSQYRFIKS